MAGKVSAAPPAAFEYGQTTMWINPATLKLRHRIGTGPFVKEDHMRVLLDKLNDLFSKCQGVEGVCFLHGISVMNGKICLVMKSYEGSVGDKMARLDRGKISLVNGSRIGTPNYMAPEQWQPEGRGTLSFKTDSWGFACSIVEMLTGVQPWCGKSVDEIYDAINSCHWLLYETLAISLQDAALIVVRRALESIIAAENSGSGYTECFLSKDYLKVGDEVRFRMRANTSTVPDGMVMGLEHSTERNGFALVKLFGIVGHFRVRISSLEQITFDSEAGKWVPTEELYKRHSPVGILHSIHRDGNVAVSYETLWKGDSSELQMAESYSTGQFVRLKGNVLIPRFEWPRKMGGAWATGRIFDVLPSGCLVVKFPGRPTFGSKIFLADPAEVEAVTSIDHWVVKLLLIGSGLFIAKKMGWLSWLASSSRGKYLFQR
ncbi:hypothetical protein Patl1_12479 [Pistacia atlantica]|uniref:Uncharacterized protein n=1 Tax=Pistacia atlantica TaxID=434234 RepID=A0ACC1AU54_9ROSI|nr:hypothetical protein Patl1_12479 [Pistacia atlantica]